jgi:hypothetical protein
LYFLSLAWLLLSLMCKATMMPFFLAALLFDKCGLKWGALELGTWCFQRKALLGVTAFAIALAFQAQSASKALELHTDFNSLIVHFFSAQAHYLAHWFTLHSCPVILNYPINPALTALLFLILAGTGSILFRKASNSCDLRIVVIGCVFWVIFLLPVSQIIKLGAAFAADRYIYLPQLGLLIALCGLLNVIKMRTARRWLICAIYALTGVATLLTSLAIHKWQSSYDLWRHAVNGGHPSWVAYVNLSVEMGIRREFLASLQTAIAGCAADENAISLFNLAGCLYDLKRFESAAWAYERSLKLDSGNRAAWLGLARLYRNAAFSKASAEQATILERRAAMLPVKAYSIDVVRSVQKRKQ